MGQAYLALSSSSRLRLVKMWFKCSKRLDEFGQYDSMDIDLVGTANLNEWGGRITPQIFVKDFEISDTILSF